MNKFTITDVKETPKQCNHLIFVVSNDEPGFNTEEFCWHTTDFNTETVDELESEEFKFIHAQVKLLDIKTKNDFISKLKNKKKE